MPISSLRTRSARCPGGRTDIVWDVSAGCSSWLRKPKIMAALSLVRFSWITRSGPKQELRATPSVTPSGDPLKNGFLLIHREPRKLGVLGNRIRFRVHLWVITEDSRIGFSSDCTSLGRTVCDHQPEVSRSVVRQLLLWSYPERSAREARERRE